MLGKSGLLVSFCSYVNNLPFQSLKNMKKYGAGEEQENFLRSNNFLSFVAYNMIEKKIMKIILYHCISEKIIIKKKKSQKRIN